MGEVSVQNLKARPYLGGPCLWLLSGLRCLQVFGLDCLLRGAVQATHTGELLANHGVSFAQRGDIFVSSCIQMNAILLHAVL